MLKGKKQKVGKRNFWGKIPEIFKRYNQHDIIVFCVIIFLIIVVLSSSGLLMKKVKLNVSSCGDGTFYDTCSLNKPYFCLDGILVENSTLCGCPIDFIKEEDSCISKFKINPKNVSLKYIIDGKEEELIFTTYKGIADYLSSLPDFIYYDVGEKISRADFKLKNINNEKQREFLLPLVVQIQNLAPNNKVKQARIAVSIVQNIPWNESDKAVRVGESRLGYSRYPYEVLYDNGGICGEKSELLIYLLREIGYGVVSFYHKEENHESVGVKCPIEYSLRDTGYCFIETSGPAIMSDNSIEYKGGITLKSESEVYFISEGISLPENMYEYEDANSLIRMKNAIRRRGWINPIEYLKIKILKKKYGLEEIYNID